ADEKFASKSDNPYEETLARLEQATIQVKNVAENLLNKQQKEDAHEDDEMFHERVRQLHAHSEEMVQKAFEKVAGLRENIKDSFLHALQTQQQQQQQQQRKQRNLI
ncbi:unnamed protein product, partial [Toxocara canis]|uniref:Mediator of RNA polymerase II transcription subunit 28 n=1 Tax=Toxocara canis TaxID=6265 RepID=A0A183VDS6_TOXCA